MIKKDFGSFNCPFYEQGFDNGVQLYFLPKNSKQSSAFIYVGKGANQLDKTFKAPFGCGYLLNKMILDKETKDQLLKQHILAAGEFDYSYSGFSLTCLNDSDIYKGIRIILDRISEPFYNEEYLDKVKKEVAIELDKMSSDDLLTTQKQALNNLYFNAPFKDGFIPSIDQQNLIHSSILRKYQEKYFTSDKIVLFISSNENSNDVLDKIVQFKYPKKKSESYPLISYDEDYSRVRVENENIHTDRDDSYLSFAIKFVKRQTIYEAYSDVMFQIYELLPDILFEDNVNFLNGLLQKGGKLIDCKLLQGSEESSLIISIQCKNSNACASYMVDYLNKLDKNIDSSTIKKAQQIYYAKSMQQLSSPYLAVKKFASVYPNHIPATSLLTSTVNLKASVIKKFLADLKTFRRSGVFISRSVSL